MIAYSIAKGQWVKETKNPLSPSYFHFVVHNSLILEKVSAEKSELVPIVCIFKIRPSTDTSWSFHGRYKRSKNTSQKFCSQKLPFSDHFKYDFEHIISIHQFLCHQKLFMISHWTQISLYFCYETNLGMQNDESATKIDVGSFCNQNLALRLKGLIDI